MAERAEGKGTDEGVQAANLGVVTTDLNAGSASEFVLQTSAPVHVIVDLFGAFTRPEATALDIVDVTTQYTVNAPGDTFTVLATCPAGYAVTGGGASLNVGVFNGVFFTELPDLDEAIRLAALIPAAADTGAIEIRPVVQ